MSQAIRKTLSIICEGSVTEPNYFHGIANVINNAEGRPRIIISPKPPLLTKEEEDAANALYEQAILAGEIDRSQRRRREMLVVKDEPEVVEIPEDFKAQPINYVWQARQALVIHDEAWAVFDLDGHPGHEQAFAQAEEVIDNKKVNVAFSSISFETWILLHFEHCTTTFSKSQCRIGDDFHDCGQGTHAKDCNGLNCPTGYMKVQGYIPKADDIKHTSYSSIKEKTPIAIENSLLLRNTYGNPLDIYKFNPITTVDRLTFKLCYISDDYKWITFADLAKHNLSYLRISLTSLKLIFTNNTIARVILLPDHFKLVNIKNEKLAIFKRDIIEVGGTSEVILDFAQLTDFAPRYLILDNENTTWDIIELQCLL